MGIALLGTRNSALPTLISFLTRPFDLTYISKSRFDTSFTRTVKWSSNIVLWKVAETIYPAQLSALEWSLYTDAYNYEWQHHQRHRGSNRFPSLLRARLLIIIHEARIPPFLSAAEWPPSRYTLFLHHISLLNGAGGVWRIWHLQLLCHSSISKFLDFTLAPERLL